MQQTHFRYHDYSNPDPPHQPLYLKTVLEFLGPHREILDAGCGDGNFAESLSQAGHKVYGIDLSEGGIAKAQSRNCGSFKLGSVYDDYREMFDRQFDAIISVEVIEHLYDPRTFTRRIHEAL